jgi:hypothetical protein
MATVPLTPLPRRACNPQEQCKGEIQVQRAGVLRDLGPYNALGRAGAPTLARSSLCPTPMSQGFLCRVSEVRSPMYIRLR